MKIYNIKLRALLQNVNANDNQLIFSNTSKEIASIFYNKLSPQEQKKSSCFYQSRDRYNYIVAHGLLRLILGRLYRIPVDEVIFHYGENNKPYVGNRVSQKRSFFNISHSGNKVLIGVSKSEVGVDVEKANRIKDIYSLSEIVLSQNEKNRLFELNELTIQNEFYKYWVIKESLLKASGYGLSMNPKELDVSAHIDMLDEITYSFNYLLNGRIWRVYYIKNCDKYSSAFSLEDCMNFDSPILFEIDYNMG